MTSLTRCRFCGTQIVLTRAGAPQGVVALGDQFFHRGCVEAAPSDSGADTPAYLIPDDV